MLKFQTMINRAVKSGDKNVREQAHELYKLNYTKDLKSDLDIEQYKQILKDKNIEYVEAEFKNRQDKTVHIVIPSLVFLSMTHRDIDRLFKV